MQAWVISLPDRPDRLAAFDERARAAGLTYQVQPGIVAGELGDWTGTVHSLGNALAHRAILERTEGEVAIFEDDAEIDPDMLERIEAGIAAVDADWEVLLIGADGRLYDGPERGAARGIRRWHQTHAYVVSGAGRAPVLSANRDATQHWDHVMASQLGRRGRSWALEPNVGQDAALGSDIPDSTMSGYYCCAPKIILPLRLSQRDDSLGLHATPRLPLGNAPSSRQFCPAPRLVQRNQYV